MTESDVCRRQILTYTHYPRTKRIKIFRMVIDPKHNNIGIQMKLKDLAKTFMMISN